jgi:prepilin-type processing-associated H-X9-DG protein
MASRMSTSNSYNSLPGGGGVFVYADTGNYYWLIRGLSNPYLPQGHSGGANFGMVDGHVVFVKWTQPSIGSATSVGTPPTVSSLENAGYTWW